MKDADVFIGLSTSDIVNPEMLLSMANNPIVFAMANPDPEIKYNLAVKTRDDIIMATGRSDTLIKSIMYLVFHLYLEVP